ncbi:hypothetical protein C6B37_01015 [Candidatus Phytoplasma phoenicium]|uniref:Uncharacterized protein n=1 Tax=Candidatus Phytoplasma phoenicium TaxID=198422 RepID=A0A2S8NUY0_9MOLU|nr:hypothetical protein C6B37_01015 [Candidatus Phytoplasma phoenicium]
MSKIIIKKNQNKDEVKTNHNLLQLTTKKLNWLKTSAYFCIILNSLLSLITIYYKNKIPWFTTGINNLINLIIPGEK